jgi:tetratricopeptide (TPR) repeat protein
MNHRLFIAYARDDEDWVKGYLKPALALGEDVRLMWEVRPGNAVGADIEDAIARSRYVLVVLSKAWEADGWEQAATTLSEHLRVTGRGPFTIPCIREDCKVSLSLETLQAIDCRDYARPRGQGSETQAETGLAALRKMLEAPAPALPEELECPYPGIVAFETRELFFGRDREIEQLVEHVRHHKRTVAVGPSGSGKSSLIRAGLLPDMPDTWPVCRVRLLDRPCAQLGQTLGMDVDLDALGDEPLPDPGPALDALLADRPADARVLVLVDPLEELFQLAPADRARAQREQQRFCELLDALTRDRRCACVLALRADFYGDLMNSPLWPLVEHDVFPIAPLAGDALSLSIQEPASRRGVSVERALVQKLIADTREEPGALPLLQETLRSLWERREQRGQQQLLSLALYQAMHEDEGGNPLAAILARKAEAALSDLPPGERALVQPLLLRLVHFGEDGRVTRRQQRLAELEHVGDARSVRRVVDHLATRRLLTLKGDGDTTGARVDLAHEAITGAWPTLARWIADWREDEQKRRRLEDRACEWMAHAQRGGLLDAVALAEAETWLASATAQRLGISDDLRGLVAASRRALARSRRRRIGAVSALAVLTVIAGIAAVVAVQQRDRALKTIRDSRELAQSIVWTADRELEPIAGTTGVREKLLDMAEHLLERLLSADTDDVEATRDMANYHTQRGDLAMSHHDLAQARAHYQKDVELTRTLVATDPGNAQWQHDLSLSYERLGNVEMAAGKLDEARILFGHSLDIQKKLAAADPGNAQWQRSLSIFYDKLGDVAVAAGKLDEARILFGHSLDLRKKLAAADPGNALRQRGLSVSYNRLGDVEVAAGKLDEARILFRDSLDIATKLAAADPGNAQWQRDLSVSYNRLGDVEVAAGKLDEARILFADSLDIRKKLAAADPGNAQWQRDLSASYDRLGGVEVAAGKLDAARVLFGDSLDIAEKLAAADPGNAEWQRDLSVAYERLGDVEVAAGKLDAARVLFGYSLDIRKKLAAADPGNAQWQRDLSLSYNKLGDVEVAVGKLDAARILFANSLDIRRKLAAVAPGNAEWQRDLSSSYNRLGDVEVAAGKLDAARILFADARDIAEKLAAADPDNAQWQRDLSLSYDRVGDMEVAAGKLDAARVLFADSLDIRKKLTAADPSNAQWQRDLSSSYNKLGDLEVAAGKLDEARVLFGYSLDLRKKLAAADPANAQWQRDLIYSEMKLALLAAEAQQPAEARRHLEAAKAVLARLDAAGLLRGDAQLEQNRQGMHAFERKLAR